MHQIVGVPKGIMACRFCSKFNNTIVKMNEEEFTAIFELLLRSGRETEWLHQSFHDLSEMIEDQHRFYEAARRALDTHERLNAAIDETLAALASVEQSNTTHIVEIMRGGLQRIREHRQDLRARLSDIARFDVL